MFCIFVSVDLKAETKGFLFGLQLVEINLAVSAGRLTGK